MWPHDVYRLFIGHTLELFGFSCKAWQFPPSHVFCARTQRAGIKRDDDDVEDDDEDHDHDRDHDGDKDAADDDDGDDGFYNAGTGGITDTYRAALRTHGLQAFFATDASIQPGQLQELMLHETAVSWMRTRLARTTPRMSWEETPEQYGTRLKACAAYINAHHDVQQLCRDLPKRLQELDELAGDRLGH